MADVAAQREARRRKITQNAEARMNKLLGLQKNHHQSSESTLQSELDESPSQNSPPHSQQNEEQPNSLHFRTRNSTASTRPTSRNISSSHTLPTLSDRSSNRSPEYSFSDHLTADVRTIPGDIENTDAAHQTLLRKPEARRTDTLATNTDAAHQTLLRRPEPKARRTDTLATGTQGLSAQTFEMLKITAFIIVAFLQRCLLKFGLGLYIVPSIFAPFIILETAVEYVVYNYLQHVALPQSKSSLMSAALMLCGMKPELTDTYNSIMAHVSLWLSDFCLYVFAFIVWNVVIV